MILDKHSLLIIKENREYCKELGGYLEATGLFEVLPPVYDGACAMERVAELKPDILLIDVILPNIDGIDVLRRMRMAGCAANTRVLALTAFLDEQIAARLQSLGVVYIIHTPATHSTILARLLDFAVQNQQVRDLAASLRVQGDVARRDELITNYLRAIGVPVNLSGYQQLKTAIAFVVASGRRQIRVTNEVYVYVAEVHGTTPKRVERNIRTAIETAWQRGDIKSQHKLFGYTVHQMKGRPTNKEFIAMIADKTMLSLGRINS